MDVSTSISDDAGDVLANGRAASPEISFDQWHSKGIWYAAARVGTLSESYIDAGRRTSEAEEIVDAYLDGNPIRRHAPDLYEALKRIAECHIEFCEGIPCGYGPPVMSATDMAALAHSALLRASPPQDK